MELNTTEFTNANSCMEVWALLHHILHQVTMSDLALQKSLKTLEHEYLVVHTVLLNLVRGAFQMASDAKFLLISLWQWPNR